MVEQHENPLLRFLKTRFQTVGDAFRTNPRHKSSAKARLSWNVGNQPSKVPARIIDISRAGAALITKKAPPDGVLVRLCVTDQDDTPWIEGKVLGSEPDQRGKYRVRIQFHDPCPTVFLKSAVFDSTAKVEQQAAQGSYESSRD